MLIGVAPSPTRTLQMQFYLRADGTAPRRAADGGGRASPREAYGVRWVCVFGVAPAMSCCALGSEPDHGRQPGRGDLHAQGGRADAYLAELPMLNRLQAMAGMALARIDWMRDTSLAMAVAPRNDVLQGLLERALEDISPWSVAPFWRQGTSSTMPW